MLSAFICMAGEILSPIQAEPPVATDARLHFLNLSALLLISAVDLDLTNMYKAILFTTIWLLLNV